MTLLADTPKGYVVAEVEVIDAAGFEDYRAAVEPMIERCGGRYMVRGGTILAIEGDAPQARVVIIEFPSLIAAEAFIRSEEYRPVAAIRHKTTKSRLFLVEGIAP